jgi:hypothetical protein
MKRRRIEVLPDFSGPQRMILKICSQLDSSLPAEITPLPFELYVLMLKLGLKPADGDSRGEYAGNQCLGVLASLLLESVEFVDKVRGRRLICPS